MNPFKQFIFKSLFSNDFNEPNKLYQMLSQQVGLGGFSFSDKNAKNFIQEGYISNPDVNSVVNKIASNFASVKWVVKEKVKGEFETVTDSPLNAIINCPNQLQTWQEFQEAAAMYHLVTGNLYINGTKATGFNGFRELTVLPSQITSPIVGNSVNPIAGYLLDHNQRQTFEFDEVLHIKHFDPRIKGFESLVGLSPLETAMFVYSANNQQWEAMASIFKNRGAAGIVTSKSERSMSHEQGVAMKEAFRESHGGAKNANSLIFTGANVDFIQLGMSPSDLKLIEQGVFSLRAICNIYKVSSVLFNDTANSTYNNVKSAEKALWTNAITPLLDKFKQGYNNWLVPSFNEGGKEYILDYDLSGIDALQEDAKERAEVSKIHREAKAISLNEYREMNGLEKSSDPKADIIPSLEDQSEQNENI